MKKQCEFALAQNNAIITTPIMVASYRHFRAIGAGLCSHMHH
jgi:hypothetical protein